MRGWFIGQHYQGILSRNVWLQPALPFSMPQTYPDLREHGALQAASRSKSLGGAVGELRQLEAFIRSTKPPRDEAVSLSVSQSPSEVSVANGIVQFALLDLFGLSRWQQ